MTQNELNLFVEELVFLVGAMCFEVGNPSDDLQEFHELKLLHLDRLATFFKICRDRAFGKDGSLENEASVVGDGGDRVLHENLSDLVPPDHLLFLLLGVLHGLGALPLTIFEEHGHQLVSVGVEHVVTLLRPELVVAEVLPGVGGLIGLVDVFQNFLE